MLKLLRDGLHYGESDGYVENLRNVPDGPQFDLATRAARTEGFVKQITSGTRGAPNLLDGAVLERRVGGVDQFFEADAVAARFAKPLHVGEIKSFPTVDGQADPDKVGAAIAQVSIYILLLRELVERVGGDGSLVSTAALLITPKNTGLQPTITVKEVGREVDRAQRILDRAPVAAEVADLLPTGIPTFGDVAQVAGRSEQQRVDAAEMLIEKIGNAYQPGCLSSCGFSRLCRRRASDQSSPVRIGSQLQRLLPQVETIERALALATGAIPYAAERPVGDQLLRAEALLGRYRTKQPGVEESGSRP